MIQESIFVINNRRVLALIPARGGSKRLPRKNVLDLAGKPLIAWTIQVALESQYVDRVVVSTDDLEIEDVSKKNGADVPFIRPPDLALDESTSIEVILHALKTLGTMGDDYEIVVLLQPTSPLRLVTDIDNSIVQLVERGDKSVVSVCPSEYSPLWSNTLPEDRSMNGFISDEILNLRSQDLPVYYRLNGAVYVMDSVALLSMQAPSLFPKEACSAFVMPVERSTDIDTALDFLFAEVCINRLVDDNQQR